MKRFARQLLTLLSLLILSFSISNVSFAQYTVVLPGSFQSQLGCSGNWMPDCDATRLSPTSPGIWEGTFYIPAGSYQYKVAYNNSWNENYGKDGQLGGENLTLDLKKSTNVIFQYSALTHLVYASAGYRSIVIAGNFQNELGCSSDWNPACDGTRLTYDFASETWSGAFSVLPGTWQFKITTNGTWEENYGANGERNGENITLDVPGDTKAVIMFRFDPVTHKVTTTELVGKVTVIGDFQSELGCATDWLADCGTTLLAFDGGSSLWKSTLTLPAGNWQFKVALNEKLDANYGEGGVLNGPNMHISLTLPGEVTFIYNPDTHITTYTIQPITAVVTGTFQNELGCAPGYFNGDWEPACDATRLVYDSKTGLFSGKFFIPAGHTEYKIALFNSWLENYGANGKLNGPNMWFDLEEPRTVTFNYNPVSHLVTTIFDVCASTFYDANADGWNNDGLPMEGIAFTITDTLTGETTPVQYSGADGRFCFTSLTQGYYTVTQTVPSGYLPTGKTSQGISSTEFNTLRFGNVCLGGAGARDIGFWINKHGEEIVNNSWLKDYLYFYMLWLNLYTADGMPFHPANYLELKTWMQRANSKNMAYMVSAQMAAMYLNLVTGLVDQTRPVYTPGIDNNFMYTWRLIDHVNKVLATNGYSVGDRSNHAMLESLKALLEQANSDLTFVQAKPCTPSVFTAASRKPAEGTVVVEPNLLPKIWPNPSAHQFVLQPATSTRDNRIEFRVIDVNGKLMYTANGTTAREYRFGEQLIPGLYFVEVRQGNNRSTIKIVKQ